jgi:hypothetical protein
MQSATGRNLSPSEVFLTSKPRHFMRTLLKNGLMILLIAVGTFAQGQPPPSAALTKAFEQSQKDRWANAKALRRILHARSSSASNFNRLRVHRFSNLGARGASLNTYIQP